MTFTLAFAWWWVPAAITVIGLVWAIFIVDPGHGWFAGTSNIMALVPVLFVAAVAWAIAGALK